MGEDMTLVAALGVDPSGDKHPLGEVEGAIENAVTARALPHLLIIDGSKALSKAVRATFSRDAAIQGCQSRKARNIMDRPPTSMHAQVRRVLH